MWQAERTPVVTASSVTVGIRSDPGLAGGGRPNRAATYLNLDDACGLADLLGKAFNLATELLIFRVEGRALARRTAVPESLRADGRPRLFELPEESRCSRHKCAWRHHRHRPPLGTQAPRPAGWGLTSTFALCKSAAKRAPQRSESIYSSKQ